MCFFSKLLCSKLPACLPQNVGASRPVTGPNDLMGPFFGRSEQREPNPWLTFHYTGCLIWDPYFMAYEIIPI